MKEFSDTELASIAARYRAGASLRQLSKDTGVLVYRIRALLVAQGVPIRDQKTAAYGRPVPMLDWAAIRRESEEGATLDELAKKYQTSWRTLRKNGIRPAFRRAPISVEKVLKQKYLPSKEAATKLQVDSSTLQQALREGRVPGAFQWHGIWFVPKRGLKEYDERRRQRAPWLFRDREEPADE